MKVLLQRVLKAHVEVGQKTVSSIANGLLIFIGIEKNDQENQAQYLAHKVAHLRIFEDEKGKMNKSVIDVKGEILVVSQFTLAGNTDKGNRPSFDAAEKPDRADELYLYFSHQLEQYGITVKNGIFQADMKVHLINDGPVTFLLEKQFIEI